MKHEFKIGDKVAVVSGFNAPVSRVWNRETEECDEDWGSVNAGTMLWIVALDGDEAECVTAYDLNITVELHNLEPWSSNAKA